MQNPFEALYKRLENIEALVLDIKYAKAEKETDPNSEPFLSIQETAKFLNLSVPTIYGLTSTAKIPFFKKGKRLYFLKSELIGYLKEGKNKTLLEITNEADTYLSKKRG